MEPQSRPQGRGRGPLLLNVVKKEGCFSTLLCLRTPAPKESLVRGKLREKTTIPAEPQPRPKGHRRGDSNLHRQPRGKFLCMRTSAYIPAGEEEGTIAVAWERVQTVNPNFHRTRWAREPPHLSNTAPTTNRPPTPIPPTTIGASKISHAQKNMPSWEL